MESKVIIIGGGHADGLTALRLAEIKAAHPNIEVVTIEEAKERGLSETFEYKARPQLDIQPIALIGNSFGDGKSNRNKRRENERKAKKNRSR